MFQNKPPLSSLDWGFCDFQFQESIATRADRKSQVRQCLVFSQSWFFVLIGLWISWTKTQTLPNLRLPISSDSNIYITVRLTCQFELLAEGVLEGDGADAVEGALDRDGVVADEVGLAEHVHVVHHEPEQAQLRGRDPEIQRRWTHEKRFIRTEGLWHGYELSGQQAHHLGFVNFYTWCEKNPLQVDSSSVKRITEIPM